MRVGELKKLLNLVENNDAFVMIQLNENSETDLIFDLAHIPLEEEEDEYEKITSDGRDVFRLFETKPYEEGAPSFDSQIRLGIPEEFIEFCTDNKTSPKEVLHGFIADLLSLHNYINSPRLDKLNRNGDDESVKAEDYFERVGYRHR